MKQLWQHSVKVAAISSLLARLCTRLDPEQVLLAGLLHNIGAVVLLNNLEEIQVIKQDAELLDSVLFDLQAEVGMALLHHWDFPEEMAHAVQYSTDWFHENSEDDDFSVIVNIAQWHAFIGTPYQSRLPNIEDISAFKNKGFDKLTPDLSFKILKQSQKEISQIISLFK